MNKVSVLVSNFVETTTLTTKEVSLVDRVVDDFMLNTEPIFITMDNKAISVEILQKMVHFIFCKQGFPVSSIIGNIKQEVNTSLKNNSKVCLIGLNHTLTFGMIDALREYDDFGLVVFDAHDDFRATWNEGLLYCPDDEEHKKLNHATWLYALHKKYPDMKILGLGMRSLSRSGFKHFCMSVDELSARIERNEQVIFLSPHLSKNYFSIVKDWLPGKIYISIDIDVFSGEYSISSMPELNGLNIEDFWKIMNWLLQEKQVTSFDLVELSSFITPFDWHKSMCATKLLVELLAKIFVKEAIINQNGIVEE